MFKKNKNLTLFLILIATLVFTYFFEEKLNLATSNAESSKNQILNVTEYGELTSFKGIKLDVIKDGHNFYSKENHVLLAKARMDEFFKILSGIKVKSFLKPEDVAKVGKSFYIPDNAMTLSFQMERGAIAFTLGKKLSYDQTFYMEVEKDGQKQLVIAQDESPDPGVYQNDKDYQKSEAKFKRLEMIFMLTNVYFYDTRLFKDIYQDEKTIQFDEIAISTFRNKKFTINLKQTSTIPEAPKALGYFEDNWISFYRALTKLSGRTVISPYEKSALDEILSQFEIKDRSGKEVVLTLYKKFGEQNGYFLTSSLDHLLYVLKPADAQYFFINVQDFWQKKIMPKAKDYQLKISFLGKAFDTFQVSDKELFKVQSLRSSVNIRTLEFKKLIDFLKIEGDHVSELTEKQSELVKKSIMQLSFENRILDVILEDNDVLLVDAENKIKIHHYVGATVPFSIKRSDYFE